MASVPTKTNGDSPSKPPGDGPTEPVGGLLAMEAADELALGGAEDYGLDDVLALGSGLDDEGPVFGLTFGEEREPTGEWDLADIQELVVNESKGHFDADSSGRDDVMIMEEEFDDEDEVVVAVWQPDSPDGELRLGTVIRRRVVVPQQYLPYGFIAAGLGVLLVIAFLGIVLVVTIGVLAGPDVEVRPLDRDKLPKVEIERKPIEDKTADEILEEVLGDDGKGEK